MFDAGDDLRRRTGEPQGRVGDAYQRLAFFERVLPGVYAGAALAALLGALALTDSVAVSQRFPMGEAQVSEGRARRAPHRWRRFRALALLTGFLLGVYVICVEVVRRRAVADAEADSLTLVLVTALGALLLGMIGRRWVRGEDPGKWPEAGYALLAAGCAGLAGLGWLGDLGRRMLAGAEPKSSTPDV